ncbi:MAG: hypothetical protein NTX96_03015 [Candidatus Zambryskibacteria bacterium]|nr:hypothetical protein [Candidatus Zambryskibacteria bacterium]
MINLDQLNKKANPFLVSFVFGCVMIIIGLLYIMQKAEAVAENLYPQSSFGQYLN